MDDLHHAMAFEEVAKASEDQARGMKDDHGEVCLAPFNPFPGDPAPRTLCFPALRRLHRSTRGPSGPAAPPHNLPPAPTRSCSPAPAASPASYPRTFAATSINIIQPNGNDTQRIKAVLSTFYDITNKRINGFRFGESRLRLRLWG